MRDEKVHAVVAHSTFPSQKCQKPTVSDHFWKLSCRKSARRCGAQHISKAKCTKHARFDHFWKLRCRKSARRCGAQHISKSKCTKHARFDHFWKLRCGKSARRCGAQHISRSRCTKHARFDHFWKLRCGKSARRCGAQHNFQVKMNSTDFTKCLCTRVPLQNAVRMTKVNPAKSYYKIIVSQEQEMA